MTWWNGIAGGAVEQVEGYAVRANTRAFNRISAVNAESSNKVRRANNTFAAARGALQRYMQSVNNNEALQAAGKALDANMRTGLKAQDKLQTRRVFGQLGDLEQQGRALAQQGAAGIGGQVVDNVNAATALRAAIVADGLKDQQTGLAYDVAQRAQTIASQMTRALDSSIIIDAIDYNTDVAQFRQEYSNFQNAIRGFASGMGQGANLYKPSSEAPQQYKAKDDYEDMRVRQRSAEYTKETDWAGVVSDNTRLGYEGNGDKQTNQYALDYGKKGSFNIRTDNDYGGL